MAFTRLSLATWNRNIEIAAKLINREGFTDDNTFTNRVKDLQQLCGSNSVDSEVPSLRVFPHKLIAPTAPAEQGPPAVLLNDLRDRTDVFRDLAHIY